MSPERLRLQVILIEIQEAIRLLLRGRLQHPALLLMYSFIDICASLVRPASVRGNREIFENYLKNFSTIRWRLFTPFELWAARSSLLHSYSPLGHNTGPGSARALFYYSHPDTKEVMDAELKARGYTNYVVVDIEQIHLVTYDAFNQVLFRMDDDEEFEKHVVANGQDILAELKHFKLGDELAAADRLIKAAEAAGGPLRVRRELQVKAPQQARATSVRRLQMVRASVVLGRPEHALHEIREGRSHAREQRYFGEHLKMPGHLEDADIYDRAMDIAERWLRRHASIGPSGDPGPPAIRG